MPASPSSPSSSTATSSSAPSSPSAPLEESSAPTVLHFLLGSGEALNSRQLRDDLMTLLIAGHETTAAVRAEALRGRGGGGDVAAACVAEMWGA